jgi:hypothetical protein
MFPAIASFDPDDFIAIIPLSAVFGMGDWTLAAATIATPLAVIVVVSRLRKLLRHSMSTVQCPGFDRGVCHAPSRQGMKQLQARSQPPGMAKVKMYSDQLFEHPTKQFMHEVFFRSRFHNFCMRHENLDLLKRNSRCLFGNGID